MRTPGRLTNLRHWTSTRTIQETLVLRRTDFYQRQA